MTLLCSVFVAHFFLFKGMFYWEALDEIDCIKLNRGMFLIVCPPSLLMRVRFYHQFYHKFLTQTFKFHKNYF